MPALCGNLCSSNVGIRHIFRNNMSHAGIRHMCCHICRHMAYIPTYVTMPECRIMQTFMFLQCRNDILFRHVMSYVATWDSLDIYSDIFCVSRSLISPYYKRFFSICILIYLIFFFWLPDRDVACSGIGFKQNERGKQPQISGSGWDDCQGCARLHINNLAFVESDFLGVWNLLSFRVLDRFDLLDMRHCEMPILQKLFFP